MFMYVRPTPVVQAIEEHPPGPQPTPTNALLPRVPNEKWRLQARTEAGIASLYETFGIGIEGWWRVSQHSVTSIKQHPRDALRFVFTAVSNRS